jgi:hypothetical protein
MKIQLHPNEKYLKQGIVLVVVGALLMSTFYYFVTAFIKYTASYNSAPPDNYWIVIGPIAGLLIGLVLLTRGMELVFFLYPPEDEMMVAP